MVIGGWGAQNLLIRGVSQENPGVLGGPVALAAPNVPHSDPSINAILGSGDPAGYARTASKEAFISELSTGSLDGTRILAEIPAVLALAPQSLVDSNRDALRAASAIAAEESARLVSSRYFIQPASGYNWGVLHDSNAIDISNSCGTTVLAAAAGTVVDDPGLGSGSVGWNGGYGGFVLIRHSNGTKTRYAHLSKVSVSMGDYVEQGEKIGEIGNTGYVQGATGCHLHFEVLGAPNPFSRG